MNLGKKKISEREFSFPMLAVIAAVASDVAELGLDRFTLILVVVAACIYSALRIWNKNVEIKYGSRCGSCEKPVPAKPDKPATP